jgi:hypothetical protein
VGGFREIVVVDAEFTTTPIGNRQGPVCFVARELVSGRVFRLFQGQFGSSPPWASGKDVLFVAFSADAELHCYRVLNWPMPERILDLRIEYRWLTNGIFPAESSTSLLTVLKYFGVDALIGADEKKQMQKAIGENRWQGVYSPDKILSYCEGDVDEETRLLRVMAPYLDWPRALFRGRYMAAVAAVVFYGIPIDMVSLELFRRWWLKIQDELIAAVDADYNVYEGGSFKYSKFDDYLVRRGNPWPRLESGALDLEGDTFRQQAKIYPEIVPLYELRHSLAQLRLEELRVGTDNRNRAWLNPFGSKTARNQPGSSSYIFGPSTWVRSLIRPEPGYGLCYLDFAQEEIGIGAALSQDEVYQKCYLSGDFYMAFARQARLAPPEATKQTHPRIRELCKQCCLAVQYGMGAKSLALRIDQPEMVARDLLKAHHEVLHKFWAWSDAGVDHAFLHSKLHSLLGWNVHLVGADANPRSIRNYPMQTNASHIMQAAACIATEAGIELVGLVHDALLIHAPLERFDADIDATRAAMVHASRSLLGGFALNVDEYRVVYPNRYIDERGRVFWNRVMQLVQAAENRAEARRA